MNAKVIAIGMCLLLGACGTTSLFTGMKPPSDTEVALKDVKISTDFHDEGIKIYYTWTGALERIEVMGMAPAWRGNVEIVAEADAMDKLVKFVYGMNTSTQRRNRIIAHTLDRARDNTLNRFRTADGTINFDAKKAAEEMEKENNNSVPTGLTNNDGKESTNTSRRIADRIERGLVEATTSITSQGRLTGVRKIKDRVVQDGRYYVAVYQWSPKEQDLVESIRRQMR